SGNQINALRMAVDKNIANVNWSKKRVFILCHFPTQFSIGPSRCHALYTNHWNYTYIDSLGFSVRDTFDENTEEMRKDGEEITIETADARLWIARSFGLPIPTNEEAIK